MADIHLVVLFNGTSNDDKDAAVTNIVKMRDGLKKNDQQFVIYRNGIGNDQEWRWFLPRLFAEITGYGGGWIMHQAYQELRRTLTQAIANAKIKTGDTLHLSVGGFSRGAALARHFANGLQNRLTHDIQNLFNLSVNVKLDCEYLFETVPSFGIPINLWLLDKLFGIRNQEINLGWNFQIPTGTKVYHAVAADERRNAFTPHLVNFKAGETEEIWFEGDHSSVGGGYAPPMKETRMSDENTLRYMVRRARENGLQFEESFLQKIGVAVTRHNPLGMMKAPRYNELPPTQRGPRTIVVKESDKPSTRSPRIAESLLQRMHNDPAYRPESIKTLSAFEVFKESGMIEAYSNIKVKQLWQDLAPKVLRFRAPRKIKEPSKQATSVVSSVRKSPRP